VRVHGSHIHLSGLGVTCPTGLVATPNGGCLDPSLPAAAKFANATPQAMTYPQAPGCPVVSLANDSCMLADGTITSCKEIQECDPITGVNHCQMQLPGVAADPSLPFCTGGTTPGGQGTPSAVISGPGTPYTPTLVSGSVPVGSGITSQQMQSLVKASGAQNVISSPAVPTAPSVVAAAPITQPTTPALVPNTSSSSTAASTSSASSSSFDLSTFLTDTPLGVPNWMIGAGGLVVLFLVMKK
jgi:hypothetical protein